MHIDKIHNERVIRVLKILLEEINTRSFNWVLVGSTNLFIQGVQVPPKDIDIVATEKDILQIEKIFQTYSIKEVVYSESEKYRSWFGRLIIDDIQIDLMANLEYKTPDGTWLKSESLNTKVSFAFENYEIPVSPIDNELLFYQKMKRKNDDMKIKAIKNFKAKM